MSNGTAALTHNRQPTGDDDDIFLMYAHASQHYGSEESRGGSKTPTAQMSPREDNRHLGQYESQDGRGYGAQSGLPPGAYAPQQSQSTRQQNGYNSSRTTSSRSRPLPATPASQLNMPTPHPYADPQHARSSHSSAYAHSPNLSVTSFTSSQSHPHYSTPSPRTQARGLPSHPHPHPHPPAIQTTEIGEPRYSSQSSGSHRSNHAYNDSPHRDQYHYPSVQTQPSRSNLVPEVTIDAADGPGSHHRSGSSSGLHSHGSRREFSDPRARTSSSSNRHYGTDSPSHSQYTAESTSPASQTGYPYAPDPRVAQYRSGGGSHTSSPSMLSPSRSPLTHSPDDDAVDGSAGVGTLLMRSGSQASFASAGSYLHEGRRVGAEPPQYPSASHNRTPLQNVASMASLRHKGSVERAGTARSVTPTPRQDSVNNYSSSYQTPVSAIEPATSGRRRNRGEHNLMASMKGALELQDDGDDEDEEDGDDELRFVNLALLSHVANRLKDKVPRGTHVKSGISYYQAFTGKDVVSTIQSYIAKEYFNNSGVPLNNRKIALEIARSLQSQLFFYEVEWGGRKLNDGVEDVFMFLDEGDDREDGERHRIDREELPTGLITVLTRCYSPSCSDDQACYSYSCPRKVLPQAERELEPVSNIMEAPQDSRWGEGIDPEVLKRISDMEKRRQTIIYQVILKEKQYVQDLDFIDSCFIRGLRAAQPPVIPLNELDEFIEDVFGNLTELRQCNRRLLDVMSVRQREQYPIIQRIGDVFLTAAADFRSVYPAYVGHLPVAEKKIKDEAEANPEFRRFLEQCSRLDTRRLDLKHFISRPAEHLQKYPLLLEAISKETEDGNPDADYLMEAEQAIKNLYTVAQLRTFQSAMGRGPTGKLEWHDLVPKDVRAGISKQEMKRQSVIWELIKTEMVYVKDLETIETLFIKPLRSSSIIPRERLPAFLHDVFHNFAEIHAHHRRMLDKLHEIQREEHPVIRSITAAVYDAALNWVDAYMEYIPHYPIAAFRIDDEMANNPSFKAFIETCTRNPESRRLDLKAFINRPIPRLLRYELLLKGILEACPTGHEDKDTIPAVLDVIKDLGKATEPGVTSAKQKVELWSYHANLVFKPGETVDMGLLDETRTLIHTGKLLRQPDTGFDWSNWTELFVLLFDNYLVMTKSKEKDGVVKYYVNKRPIPLDLLTILSFNEPPQQKAGGLLRGRANRSAHGGGDNANAAAAEAADSRSVYPLQLHHNGRMGGIYQLYAESAQARQEWKLKLEEAMGLRKVVQDANKVFEIETLSIDTFLVPSMHHNAQAPSWNEESMFTGKVTCSVPFTTSDGRGLVAIGCAEGVWIGLRHDSKSMRRVLHLKMVTQCAMLEDFGIFLVLADKSLFAYHIEALVPSNPPSPHATRTPQKLNGSKDVHFFSVGTLGGRTLIIYMKKRSMDSVFRVLEPVVERITEKTKATGGFPRFNFGGNRSEWFRIYRDFFLPSEAYDLIFLKAKIAILCTKGFEIMDLTDFKSVSIPQRDDPRLATWSKRLESCKPLGMFRCSENEFLLCYDEFGMYVDRHGDPSRAVVTVEWEGTAEKVAYHPPYILLFDPRFIEIRHVDTGRLAQIIPGNDVRCLWDGRGASVPPIQTPGADGWQEGGAQDARVHATMRVDEPQNGPHGFRPSGMAAKAVAQHVFELLPTIPLFLPGSFSSPSQSTYFPVTGSPPHSPQMRLQPTWSR